MEKDLLKTLESVGYEGSLLDSNNLSNALELGPKSTKYTSLVAWLAKQIQSFVNINETIHPTTTPDDASYFLLELSCFLKQIDCINQNLTTGNVNQRLNTKENKILLLEILITELMTLKLLEAEKVNNDATERIVSLNNIGTALNTMLEALNLSKPPKDITIKDLSSKLENRLIEVISKSPRNCLGQPLFYGKLSTDQWDKLSKYNYELCKEYEIRSRMLITRMDLTMQSFKWSEKGRICAQELNKLHTQIMSFTTKMPSDMINDLFIKRLDLAIMGKTSNAAVRKCTQSDINKVLIGDVPDRGGRPYEQEPPPPEMPPWQKDRVARPPPSGGYNRGGNTSGSAGRGRGGGGGGGVRGGRGGRGNYVSTGGGYASARDSYGASNTYSEGEGSNNYGGTRRDYSAGGPGNYGQDYQHNSGRGGRVQGGWNQGGYNSNRNDYQRDGYNRGRGRGKR